VSTAISLCYILSAVLFILGLKMMGNAATAVRGNGISALGMLLAVVVTLLDREIVTYQWIVAGVVVGGAIGLISAIRVPMTSMPEFVALFNGTGGLASLLVGWEAHHNTVGHYLEEPYSAIVVPVIATFLSVLIGGVTFTGSMVAYAKLAEKISGKPVLFSGQQVVNGVVLLGVLLAGVIFTINPDAPAAGYVFYGTIILSFVLGVLATIPIGGADMPVVISLLNSYSGLAACAAGFVIEKYRAHRVRLACGRQRDHPDQYHVQGHEPVAVERSLQRLWQRECHVRRRRACRAR
jgi:NAD(P) transhydrogenase subunit beta